MFSNKRTYCKYLLLAILNLPLLGLASPTVSPKSFLYSIIPPLSTYVISLSVGPVWEQGGTSQTFYLTPTIEKTYDAKKSNRTLANGEVFIGIQQCLPRQLTGQLGVALVSTGNAKLSGEIWDDADPQFDNSTYHYRISHTHVALKGKLLMDNNFIVIPWVSGSVGIGFNRAHQFNNSPTIFEYVKTPNFGANTQSAFTYTVGIGVQRMLNKNWQIGIGFEFADWGKSKLDRAPKQTLGKGLKLDHLYTKGLLLNVTFVI